MWTLLLKIIYILWIACPGQALFSGSHSERGRKGYFQHLQTAFMGAKARLSMGFLHILCTLEKAALHIPLLAYGHLLLFCQSLEVNTESGGRQQ